MADFFEAGKIQPIREIAVLLRFHGLHATIVALKKNAFAVGLVLQGQTAPTVSQARELLNEIRLADIVEIRESGNFVPGQANLSGHGRPAKKSA